jgi:cytochrome o ubiquinol oxidase operon protein cyoD
MINSYKIIDEREELSKNALSSYITGFILSIALTIVPYFIVVHHTFGKLTLVLAVTFFGIGQLFVQVIFFLHLHKKSKLHWNMIVFLFTLLIVAFLVVGTLWIMYHLNYNMMGVTPFNSNEGFIPQ